MVSTAMSRDSSCIIAGGVGYARGVDYAHGVDYTGDANLDHGVDYAGHVNLRRGLGPRCGHGPQYD